MHANHIGLLAEKLITKHETNPFYGVVHPSRDGQKNINEKSKTTSNQKQTEKRKLKLLEKEEYVNHIQTLLKSNIKLVNFPIHLFSTSLQFSDVSRSKERVH